MVEVKMQNLFHSNQVATILIFFVQCISIFIAIFCTASVVVAIMIQRLEALPPTKSDYIQYSKLTLYGVLAATVAIVIHLALHYGIIK